MERFLSRLSVALHRKLMEAYLARVQLFRGMSVRGAKSQLQLSFKMSCTATTCDGRPPKNMLLCACILVDFVIKRS